MNDVNLLPDVKVSSMAENRMRRNFVVLVAVFSLVWLVVVGGLFGFNQMSIDKLKMLEDRKIANQQRIAGLSSLGIDLVTLKQKLAGIKFIKDGRYDFPESLKYVLGLFPDNVKVTKISISENGEIVLSLNSTDTNGVAAFISQMGQESVLKFPKLASLRLSDEGKYSFVISARYGKGTKFTTNK
jgi:Tfp pilus assembly protein PilN